MNRYETMTYRRAGRSGLKLPSLSLGLWNNFGLADRHELARKIVLKAFDLGITHFDLANNYGPPPGSAEETFGRLLVADLASHRDELLISTKAGYNMWPGPYGEWGSRKSLLASLDQSLRRMRLDYVDIFYSHRFDPDTPLEETMGALASAVQRGKALYVGLSNYDDPAKLREAAGILRALGTPCLIHQPAYHLFHRGLEREILGVQEEDGVGCIAFCPLDQGVLTNKYLNGIPDDSRAAKPHGTLKARTISEDKLKKVASLNEIALERGQTMAQFALAWVLRHDGMTSALIGASKPEQVEDCVGCLQRLSFTDDELARIDAIAPGVTAD